MTQNDATNGSFQYEKGDEQLIAALAAGKTHEEAAKAAGVSRATVTRRLQDPAFCRGVERVRKELFEAAIAQLAGIASEATQTLRRLLNGDTPPTVQLGAARAILDYALRQKEANEIQQLQERLDQLETLLQGVRR